MAKTRKRTEDATLIQRPPAELLYADELTRLREHDADKPRPRGWTLSMGAVRSFILGDDELELRPKFVGNPALVDRPMVTLATSRGLLLVGDLTDASPAYDRDMASSRRRPRAHRRDDAR